VSASSVTQSRIAAGRSIVRSLYALSRTVRVFGIGHPRTRAQLVSAYARVHSLIPANGVRIDLNADQLSVESHTLDLTSAEQTFARFLRDTEKNSFSLDESFTIGMMEEVVSAMASERGTAAAAPSSSSAVEVTGAGSRRWLDDPEQLLTLIDGALQNHEPQFSSVENAHARLAEQAYEDVARILQALSKVGMSETEEAAFLAVRELRHSPRPLLDLLRETLSELQEIEPPPVGDTLLLRTAQELLIRLILTKLENGDLVAAEIPGLLTRLGRQLSTLHALMPSYEEKRVRGGPMVEGDTEVLEKQLWSTAPDAAKRMVLLFDTPFYVPPQCIIPFLEKLIAHGDETVAATVLKNYGAAVDGRDAEGRRRSAKGISDLAEMYALVVPEYVPKLMKAVSRQLMRESDLRMQSWLSTALIRLTYAVQQQRDFAATAAASDALDEIVHRRPMLGMELRPRISVENRLPEYVDEALTAKRAGDDLVSLLQRHAVPVTQQLCTRFLNCTLREETERISQLAAQLGQEAQEELWRRLRVGSSEDALSAVGLMTSLAPDQVVEILPKRASEWDRAQQDVLVRQLAVAASPRRGGVLLTLLPELDTLIIPGAIDEIGMSGDAEATSQLIQIAHSSQSSRFTDYSKVKAIEALGRLHAGAATTALEELLHARKMLRPAQPQEVRIASLQALHMIDPERAASLVPQSGVTSHELSLGPLAIDPNNPWARQRRYLRVFPLKPMSAVASSQAGRAGLDIVALSLGGGRARRQGKVQPGSNVTLQLQLTLRRLNSQVLVREVAGNEITFEIADMGLSDRWRLRHFLLSQTMAPLPGAAA
jgi:hypothetical protein